jgi:arylsulfatase A-like enzyme
MGALARSHRLASHLDLAPTLIDWIGNKPAATDGLSLLPLARGDSSAWRQTLVGASDSGQLAIRNSDWCLRRSPASPNDEEASFELYVRPDDRCEANDVASLCPDVVQHLSEELDRVARQLTEGNSLASPMSPASTPGDIPL